MGLFLDMSGVIGQSKDAVFTGLQNYLTDADGGIEPTQIETGDKDFGSIYQAGNNTTVLYPTYFLKTEECSAYLSQTLNTPVFSLQIHDGDYWTYTLFVNGEKTDQFMPIPDYFDDVSDEEIYSLKGNAHTLAKYIPGLKVHDVDKYLVRWNLDDDEAKAYEDDEFENCDWQLLDFMRKVKLPYPLDDKGRPKGDVYSLWIKEDEKPVVADKKAAIISAKDKPWWKFW